MAKNIKAIFHGGAFVPQEPCDLPEDSQVELIIQGPFLVPPAVKSPTEKTEILKAVVQRMRANPIPAGAPPLTREALHDRR